MQRCIIIRLELAQSAVLAAAAVVAGKVGAVPIVRRLSISSRGSAFVSQGERGMVTAIQKGGKAPFRAEIFSQFKGEIMKIYGMTTVLCVGVLTFQTEAYAQSHLT